MRRARALLLGSCLLTCLGLAAPLVSQEAEPVDAEVAAKAEKYLELAQTGRIPVRPQAARRLIGLGEPALERVRQACGPEGSKLAGLGTHLVEVLPEFGDAELRAWSWRSLRDLDFPWRPAAARGLAVTAVEAEAGDYWSLLDDHLAPVRAAAIEALGRVGSGDELQRARLVDHLQREGDDIARRAGVLLLDDWGEPGYLIWLVEDLRRTDAYFQIPFGEQARYQSARALEKRLGDLHGYDPGTSPLEKASAQAIEAIAATVLERAGGELPEVLFRAAEPIEGNVIGLELRSCREGTFFLSWSRDDVLHFGQAGRHEWRLEAGTVARLEPALAACLAPLEDERFWGAAGCDLEHLRLVDREGATRSYLVSKGPEAVPELRPEALDRAVALLVETLPETLSPSQSDGQLRDDVRRALLSIGGPLE